MDVIDIGPWQLALCLLFVAVAGTGSAVLRLGLERDLAWGTVRSFAQLFLVGYVLRFVFGLSHPALVVLLFAFMVFWAAHAVRGRIREKQVGLFLPTYVSMFVSYLAVAVTVTGLVVRADPWYSPQYFIPLGGMIAGNSMNAITLALERLLNDLRRERGRVELDLCLGASAAEASAPFVRAAVKAGMIPSINALMTVGLVSLPGMMTGQILAGADPLVAVKYQIVVMLMLVAAAAISTAIVVHAVRRRCFGRDSRLLLR